jgi:hypothetical protein
MTLGTIISGIWGFVKGAATSIIKAVTSLNPTQALSAGLFVGGAIATVILGVRSLINRINSYRNRKNVSIVDSALTSNNDKQSQQEVNTIVDNVKENNLFDVFGGKHNKSFKRGKHRKNGKLARALKNLKTASIKRQMEEESKAYKDSSLNDDSDVDIDYDMRKFNQEASEIVNEHPEVFSKAIKNLSVV